MDPVVEPGTVARHVSGSQSKLYWGRGARPEPQGSSAAHAVLVVDGERYVRGGVETSDGSDLPEGSPVSPAKYLGDGRALRAIRPYPVWDPALHSGYLWALLISLLALGIIMFGVGTVMTIILAVVAFLSPGLAWLTPRASAGSTCKASSRPPSRPPTHRRADEPAGSQSQRRRTASLPADISICCRLFRSF